MVTHSAKMQIRVRRRGFKLLYQWTRTVTRTASPSPSVTARALRVIWDYLGAAVSLAVSTCEPRRAAALSLGELGAAAGEDTRYCKLAAPPGPGP